MLTRIKSILDCIRYTFGYSFDFGMESLKCLGPSVLGQFLSDAAGDAPIHKKDRCMYWEMSLFCVMMLLS